MRRGIFLNLAALLAPVLLASTMVQAQDAWQPAKGPLATRWAKEVAPDKALPEYPRPQMARKEWQNLNGLWNYAIKEKGGSLPDQWVGQILVPFPVESALSGVMKRVSEKQELWYKRSFEVPAGWKGQRVLLHFGAVDWQTKVTVNGKLVGEHKGGYDPFTLDITDALKDGAQEIVVQVWDPTSAGTQPRGKQVMNPNGIWYTPTTGIWQTVWIEPVPQAYISTVKLTPDIDNGQVSVKVVGGGAAEGATVKVVALDGDNAVGEATGKVGEAIAVKVPSPKLWSPDSPFLYNAKVTLEKDGKAVDEVASYFGMRKIAMGKDDKGILRPMLNGKFVFQVGPLDQGFWPDGLYTAPTDEALRYDIEVTRKLGFNVTRKHVKIEPDRWYYWCDKLGLMVWQDMPSGDNAKRGKLQGEDKAAAMEQFEAELAALIENYENHPSIILWVVFNEGWGEYEREDAIRVVNWVKKRDPSRLANVASGWDDHPVGDVIDMHRYPGPGAPKHTATRASVLGEFGGLKLAMPGHMWKENKSWGYREANDNTQLTNQYVGLLKRSWELKDSAGLSAAIYTQITDVETEANGLLTYDRAVIKVNVDRVSAANQGKDFTGDEMPNKK